MSKVAPWVVDHTLNGQQAEFIVVLADQADLSEAKSAKTKRERGRKVRDALWEKAQQTQQPIIRWLEERKIEYRPFYIINALWVKGDAKIANTLAARSDVLRVEGNPTIYNAIRATTEQLSPSAPEATPPPGIQTGIAYSHAPDVWSLGDTGQGIVIASGDTGVRWTHAAIKNQYRGWNGSAASHDYNWHDSIHPDAGLNTGGVCGTNSTEPCDDQGHGTHTTGTAVGDDGNGNQIGMAPGAKWIGCRNMDRGNGTPARYIECMEFFLAPYPVGGTTAQGNPDLAPDISTNSWGCPPTEGCSVSSLQAAVEAQRAAGIFMVVAAGNKGSNCNTVQDPPGIYDAVYSVGALTTGTDTIASFSSRGSVSVDGSLRLKPYLSAPGTTVRSAVGPSGAGSTDTSYTTMSGTSMATPHVAGAVALIWSAQPSLRNDINKTEAILNASAFHIANGNCDGGTALVPNNTFGYGRLDAKAAVDHALLEITAIVPDNAGGLHIQFYAGANRTYHLEQEFDMTNSWQPVPGVNDLTANTNGPAEFVDPNGQSHPEAFYRIRITQ